MKKIKILHLSVSEFAKIIDELKAKGYTLEQIEKMVKLK